MDEQLVLVSANVQADVADREKGGFVLLAELAGALHDRKVQTGLLQFFDVLNRQIRHHALVAFSAEHETVGVDRLGQLRQRRAFVVVVVQIPTAAAAAALVLGKKLRQRLLAHAQEFDVDLGHVHRYHRQAAAVARRQYAALRGEAHGRVEFAGVDLLFDIAAKTAAVRGGELAGDGQRVLGVGGDEREAQDLAAVVQLPAAFVVDRCGEGDQRVEILRADQRPGKLECDRQGVAFLIGIGPHQREFLDVLAFGLNGFAADLGQLPRVLVTATGQHRQGQCQPYPGNPMSKQTANSTHHH